MSFLCKLTFATNRETGKTDLVYTGITGKTSRQPLLLSDLTRETIERLNFWIKKDQHCDREDLALLGRYLYQTIFPPGSDLHREFDQDFRYFINQTQRSGRLRFVLVFNEEVDPVLVDFPWEFLFKTDATGSFFLAGQHTELILTRFVPERVTEFKPSSRPLRIMVAVAQPVELGRLNADAILDDIRRLATGHPEEIEVRILDNPTYKQLSDLLNPTLSDSFLPHIFHFIGHGRPGELALFRPEEQIKEDEFAGKPRTEAEWCDSTTVGHLFNRHQPRVAFLHACKGVREEAIEGFSTLARDLVYSKIPAVVAMQYEMEAGDAAVFSREFYLQISHGQPIDEAVRAGREALGAPGGSGRGAWNDRRFGTPVVYLQSEKAIILPVDEQTGSLSTPTAPAAEKVPCPNPQCTGFVIKPTARICLACFERVEPCPSCGHMMWVKGKVCGNCLHGLDQIQGLQHSAADQPSAPTSAAAAGTPPPTGQPAPDRLKRMGDGRQAT